MIYPDSLSKIINFYKKVPGVGEKSAERYATAMLELPMKDIQEFSKKVLEAKELLHPCKICGHLTDQEVCPICSDDSRNHNLIMVLGKYKDVFAFEKVGNYNGVYHVLGGLISPIDGIGPDDINIGSLLQRLESLENPEIILALKSSIEGETTTLYIKKKLEGKNIAISRLSNGLPMGADIDYLDAITLDLAIKDRKNIS